MSYQLRPYQQTAANMAVRELRMGNKPFIVQAATGAGKSLIIAEICHQINQPILVLQPSKEILEQNYNKLKSYGVTDVSIYSASMNTKEISKFTYATIGSIYKKPELFKHFKYVIIDECHGVDPKNLNGMYKQFLAAIECTKICGLTATPYRMAQKYIWENGAQYYTASIKLINRISWPTFWKDIIYKIETEQLIKEGYLCPIRYYADNVDDSGLQPNTTGADFTEASVNKFWNNDKLRRIAQAVQFSHENHQRTLIFCSSIRQAENAKALCEAMGVQTQLVTGKTTKADREKSIALFKSGEIKHLFNVGVFTTGFDMPILDCIVLARPTMSLALYYQMVGRGVRLDSENPNKILTVYDMCGVVKRLGRVETIKVEKEVDGFKDVVRSERGRIDNEVLFKFYMKPKEVES